MSDISEIRASLQKPGRSHICSLRRQFYIKEEDVKALPESIQVNFENTTYWMYLTTESTLSFLCKQTGHIAKNVGPLQIINCKTNNNASPNETQSEKFEEFVHPIDVNNIPKRPLSITSSDNSSTFQNQNKTQTIDNFLDNTNKSTQLENNAGDE